MRIGIWIAAAIVALATLAGGAAWWVMESRAREPFRGYETAEQFIEITSGMGPRAIARQLVTAGVVRDELTFRFALWRSGQARRLQAGEYRFDRPATAHDVIDRIARGDVYLVSITFREGLTIPEMAAVFEGAGFGTAGEFIDAARDPSPVKALDPQATDLEGYLFPDTYAVPRRTTAPRLVAVMVEHFQKMLGPEVRSAAAARGLTIRQLVTLASLVEKETAVAEERPLVSAVYHNRIRLGMLLQCDPTVIYALAKAGQYDGNLRRADLAFDSPYNTYRYPGLPPGPIAAPGQWSLVAAATPADVDYLFFVSRNDGSHEFARTLPEHNRNVQRYQVQYFRNLRRSGASR
jgi:UPF0755 protein